MATLTTRLQLRKPDPDPATGDLISVTTDINESMDKLDAAVGATICTSGTRPTGTARWDGREIFETDTLRRYMWHEALTAWLPVLIGRGTDGPYLLGVSTDTAGIGFNMSGAAAGDDTWRSRVSGDANPRFTIDADGRLQWGPGTAAVDTNLRRSAADTLRTDDNFSVGGNLTITGTAPLNKLGENILAVNTASVTFSSIPSTYRSLMLMILARSSNASEFVNGLLRFNGDTGTNYDCQQVTNSGTGAATAFELLNVTSCVAEITAASSIAGSASAVTYFIPWYANTTFWKHLTASHVLSNQTSAGQAGKLGTKHWAYRWRSTAAVNSITIALNSGNFIAGSSFALYGLA